MSFLILGNHSVGSSTTWAERYIKRPPCWGSDNLKLKEELLEKAHHEKRI